MIPCNPRTLLGCQEPIFGVAVTPTVPCPAFFLSSEQTVSCPMGESGGPFTSVAGKFTSLISQADADAQATTYLDNLLATKCFRTAFFESEGIETGGSTGIDYLISVDGSTYATPVYDSNYAFISQLKMRVNLANGMPIPDNFFGLLLYLNQDVIAGADSLVRVVGNLISMGNFLTAVVNNNLLQGIVQIPVGSIDQTFDLSGITIGQSVPFTPSGTLQLQIGSPFSVNADTYMEIVINV